jgi:thioredoxin-like negative regulator of GroEL
MKILITKPVVLGIKDGDEHSTHGKPGEIHELSSKAGNNIVSVEKGIDVSKMDPKKIKELQTEIEKAQAEAEKAIAAAAKAEAQNDNKSALNQLVEVLSKSVQARDPKIEK